jgi:shikimate dehydrogenase
MTERVGLLGWPVGHSRSPVMHQAAFAALGLDWQYDLLPVAPEHFEAEVTRLIAAGYRGFNVTIPHKQAAFRLPQIREITPHAQTIGAVNTLTVLPDGSLKADNTDWRGFADDLAAHHVNPRGTFALLLGAGGGSQAVNYALKQLGAETLAADLEPKPGQIVFSQLPDYAERASIIVHCTPVGMFPKVDASVWPDDLPFPKHAVLYDLVYNPPITRLMQQAEAAGAQVISGLGMLVRQGAFSFEQWTGIMPSVDIMYNAALNFDGAAQT